MEVTIPGVKYTFRAHNNLQQAVLHLHHKPCQEHPLPLYKTHHCSHLSPPPSICTSVFLSYSSITLSNLGHFKISQSLADHSCIDNSWSTTKPEPSKHYELHMPLACHTYLETKKIAGLFSRETPIFLFNILVL